MVVGGKGTNFEVGGSGRDTLLKGQGWAQAFSLKGGHVMTDASVRIGHFQQAPPGYLATMETFWANYEHTHPNG
jgi:hypothetical protein